MKKNIRVVCIIVLSALFLGVGYAQVRSGRKMKIINQGQKIGLNEMNYIKYRIDDINNDMTLDFVIDGIKEEMPVGVLKTWIGGTIYDIKYLDKSHVWIVSRLGRLSEAATLVDLKSKSVVKTFEGTHFAFSPDNRFVAYLYDVGDKEGDALKRYVFVDDVMIYTEKRIIAFDDKKPFPSDRQNGIQFGDFVNNDEMSVENFLRWTNDNCLLFALSKDGKAYIQVTDGILKDVIDDKMTGKILSISQYIKGNVSKIDYRTSSTLSVVNLKALEGL